MIAALNRVANATESFSRWLQRNRSAAIGLWFAISGALMCAAVHFIAALLAAL